MFRWLASLFGTSESPEVAEAKRKMELDKADPRRRYIWSILAISASSDADPGYLPEFASMAMRDWYGMSSREELLDNIDYYIEGTGSTPGYDVFRAVFMARAGFGAGMLSEAESWEAAYRVARKMQQAYPSWNHYGMGYIEGHVAYRTKQGDDADTVAGYRKNLLERFQTLSNSTWAETPFQSQV